MENRKSMPYGFAAYSSMSQSHRIALSNYSKNTLSSHIRLAPRPEDIIWSNISVTKAERLQKHHSGNMIFLGICIAWIIPNAFISTFLTQISRIGVVG